MKPPEPVAPLVVEFGADPDRVERAVAEAAEQWGGEWDGATRVLVLPLSAGLFRGTLSATLRLEAAAGGTRASMEGGRRGFELRGRAALALLLGLLGALPVLAWPFFPALLPYAPMGLGLALAAWLLVVARLTTNSPEDFFELVRHLLAAGEKPGE